MKIRLIQFSPHLGDVQKNFEFHRSTVSRAIEDKIDLIIFPELSLSGYHMKDIVYDVALTPDSEIIEYFKNISKDISIVVGLPFEERTGIIFNSAVFFSEGKIVHRHDKVQLPNFGMFEEKMIFKSGENFMSFETGNFRAGILICREILFPENAYLYFLQNTDLLIGISNSPHRAMTEEGFSSLKLWERLGEVYAINYLQHFVFVNRTGFEDGIGFGGGSFYSAPGKGIVKKAKYFEADSIDVEIYEREVRSSRISSNYLRDKVPEIILNELMRIRDAKN